MTCNSPIPPTNFSCSSSSSLDEATNQKYSCKNVFDYRQLTSWAANSERVGAWIFIDLNNYYKLSHIILRRRFRGVGYDYKAEIKGITIQISDGSRKRNDELPKKEIIRLLVGSYLNSTQTINLTVTAVFNTFTTSSEQSQIGFSEIKFCGSKTNGNILICLYEILEASLFIILFYICRLRNCHFVSFLLLQNQSGCQ